MKKPSHDMESDETDAVIHLHMSTYMFYVKRWCQMGSCEKRLNEMYRKKERHERCKKTFSMKIIEARLVH